MHVKNTERIITQILRQPERFRMATWVWPKYEPATGRTVVDVCGTACCIAGWAILNDLTDGVGSHDVAVEALVEADGVDWIGDGGRLLGLPSDGGDVDVPLFDALSWPSAYKRLRDQVEADVALHDYRLGEAVAGATLLRDMLDGTVETDGMTDEWWDQFAQGVPA